MHVVTCGTCRNENGQSKRWRELCLQCAEERHERCRRLGHDTHITVEVTG